MRRRDLPLISPDDSLLRVLQVIDAGGFEGALVVEGERLVGLVTDGDARRALLRGKSLESPVKGFMQSAFTTVQPGASRAEVLDIMKARSFKQVPVVDAEGRLLGLHLLHDLLGGAERPNAALIFCGGFGTRLRPLTERIPKPMVEVAGRPILERIVLHLVGHGFRRVFLATHYLSEMIEAHFGDGERFGCEVAYLKEEQPLGTGGALALMPPQEHAILAMNGDLVSQFDASRMLDHHLHHRNRATMAVQTYVHDVPFGVAETQGQRLLSLREKPKMEWQVNAGIYVLDPDLPGRVPAGVATTLPAVLEDCVQRKERVGVFRLDQDWMDVGRPDELAKARGQA